MFWLYEEMTQHKLKVGSLNLNVRIQIQLLLAALHQRNSGMELDATNDADSDLFFLNESSLVLVYLANNEFNRTLTSEITTQCDA